MYYLLYFFGGGPNIFPIPYQFPIFSTSLVFPILLFFPFLWPPPPRQFLPRCYFALLIPFSLPRPSPPILPTPALPTPTRPVNYPIQTLAGWLADGGRRVGGGRGRRGAGGCLSLRYSILEDARQAMLVYIERLPPTLPRWPPPPLQTASYPPPTSACPPDLTRP